MAFPHPNPEFGSLPAEHWIAVCFPNLSDDEDDEDVVMEERSPQTNLSSLPLSMLCYLFRFCEDKDWNCFAEVCREWNDQCTILWRQLETLRVSPSIYRDLAATKGGLDLRWQVMTDRVKHLKSLELHRCHMEFSGLTSIFDCRDLQELRFTECPNVLARPSVNAFVWNKRTRPTFSLKVLEVSMSYLRIEPIIFQHLLTSSYDTLEKLIISRKNPFECTYCGRRDICKFDQCAQCDLASYCTLRCQSLDWTSHQNVCILLKANGVHGESLSEPNHNKNQLMAMRQSNDPKRKSSHIVLSDHPHANRFAPEVQQEIRWANKLLMMHNHMLASNFMDIVFHCRAIVYLDLSWHGLLDAFDMLSIGDCCENLRYLFLNGCELTPNSLEPVLPKFSLNTLALRMCSGVSDSTMQAISETQSHTLEDLDVCRCSKLTQEACLAVIRSCYKLMVLNIACGIKTGGYLWGMTDHVVDDILLYLNNLKELSFVDSGEISSGYWDRMFRAGIRVHTIESPTSFSQLSEMNMLTTDLQELRTHTFVDQKRIYTHSFKR